MKICFVYAHECMGFHDCTYVCVSIAYMYTQAHVCKYVHLLGGQRLACVVILSYCLSLCNEEVFQLNSGFTIPATLLIEFTQWIPISLIMILKEGIKPMVSGDVNSSSHSCVRRNYFLSYRTIPKKTLMLTLSAMIKGL